MTLTLLQDIFFRDYVVFYNGAVNCFLAILYLPIMFEKWLKHCLIL
ncbi:hypothetical protein SME53J_21340 [Serratia marcescens]|nr:hypothetical protein SME53J_21340 [Serratia marcescens]